MYRFIKLFLSEGVDPSLTWTAQAQSLLCLSTEAWKPKPEAATLAETSGSISAVLLDSVQTRSGVSSVAVMGFLLPGAN